MKVDRIHKWHCYEIDRNHIVELGPKGYYYIEGGISMRITDALLAAQSEERRTEIIKGMEVTKEMANG